MANDLIINAGNAAVYYGAFDLAIGDVREVLARGTKASQPYRGALELQLKSYETERARIAAAFPDVAK